MIPDAPWIVDAERYGYPPDRGVDPFDEDAWIEAEEARYEAEVYG